MGLFHKLFNTSVEKSRRALRIDPNENSSMQIRWKVISVDESQHRVFFARQRVLTR